MDWLLKIMVAWLSVGCLIISTGWYSAIMVKTLFPRWWRSVVVWEDHDLPAQ